MRHFALPKIKENRTGELIGVYLKNKANYRLLTNFVDSFLIIIV